MHYVNNIRSGWMGLDNGPDATKEIQNALSDCKTIIWNGPSKFVTLPGWGNVVY